jgi:hypothetical protein
MICERTFYFYFQKTGGTLGLFTGMSILSMVEIVFWLAKIPAAFFRAR